MEQPTNLRQQGRRELRRVRLWPRHNSQTRVGTTHNPQDPRELRRFRLRHWRRRF